MKRTAPEVLYMLAVDFINLRAIDKFNIGREMNILTEFDVLSMSEKAAEVIVFSEAYRSGKLETFIAKMYKAAYAN